MPSALNIYWAVAFFRSISIILININGSYIYTPGGESGPTVLILQHVCYSQHNISGTHLELIPFK